MSVLESAVLNLQSSNREVLSVKSCRENQHFSKTRDIIYSVDLSSTLNRLVQIEGWKSKEAEVAIKQYRNYLFLRKKYPGEILPPSYEIDEVWHAHILHTKEYRDFCKTVFYDHEDSYLDHYPHIASAESQLALEQAYQNTQLLYKTEFGEYIYKVFGKRFFENLLDKLRKKMLARYPDLLSGSF